MSLINHHTDSADSSSSDPTLTLHNTHPYVWNPCRLVRGLEDSPAGQCGVAMQGSFPVKSSPNPPPSPPAPPEPPSPPTPEPVQCDDTTSCPNGALFRMHLA